MYRRDRINERDVPESQHTIFIRGLPGTMTTEDIRGFFVNDGTCSFDFVKVSPDRTKLYVAVRFDSKNSAREVMEKYGKDKDGRGEILGHEVELSWFRDIRRYLAHCAKQGVAPSRFNGSGGGGGRRDFREGGFRPRGRGRSRSMSPLRTRTRSHSSQQNSMHSQSRSRSNSASPDHEGRDNRTVSRSRSRSRSQSGEPDQVRHSRSRSKSASSVASSVRSERNKSADYNDIKKERSPTPPPKRNKQKKKERKAERKRRRHHHQSPSQSPVRSERGVERSDMEASDGEIVPSPKSKNGKPPSMMVTSSKSIGPNKPPEAFYQQQMVQKQQTIVTKQDQQPQPAQKSYTLRHIPDGSLATNHQQQQMNNVVKNEVAMLAAAAVTNTYQIHQQQQPDSSSGYGTGIGGGGGGGQLQNNNNKFRQTLFTVDLDNSSNIPKFKQIPDGNQSNISSYSSINGAKANDDIMVKRPRLDSPPLQPSAAAPIRNSAPLASSSPIRESGALAGGVFKDIQRQILQDVRYKQPDVEEESLGGLRLSALSRQRMTDDMREEKVAKLSPEMRERVAKKKRQLELSYRHDCETFGLVTRKLIEKDRTLEDRLKLALLDTMKDLEGETLKQLDEFLDQLSFIY